MPDLIASLQGHDLGHLRIIAELWGIELGRADVSSARGQLAAGMSDRELAAEIAEALPEPAQAALSDLKRHHGRIPWARFTRRYGQVRPMGPARRDRERPDYAPNSPAEALWYRGLIARAFFDSPSGPEEFAFIPDDLIALLPDGVEPALSPPGRAAAPAEFAEIEPVSDRILDHACTLLAALRMQSDLLEVGSGAASWHVPPPVLQALLSAAGLLGPDHLPVAEATRDFLEAERGDALGLLARAWQGSTAFNELRLIPHLQAEGEWENDPLRARQELLTSLKTIPPGTWWSLPAFVTAIHQTHPDFQRPAGDYDSWYLRDRRTDQYLRGFENWDRVEGELIRFLITGPLHWLGIVDIAGQERGAPALAFRFTGWASALLEGRGPEGLQPEDGSIHVRSDGEIRIPRLAPRPARYQFARFSAWRGEAPEEYRYRLTPASLARAREQGLQVSHLLALLQRHCDAIPPSLVSALKRWELHGAEAHFEHALVLRLASPELLQALRQSRAARFLGDPLGPTAVIVKSGAWERVLAALAEMGYLGEMADP